VDAAWAAHFGFHPGLPQHALALGADAMVTSAHKTLPAYSQGALVLSRGDRLDRSRLAAGADATATTSPAGSILASIDAARALLQRDGETLLGGLIALVAEARGRIAAEPGVGLLDGPDVDPTKLVVLLAGAGVDGTAVERDLVSAGLPVELADRDTLVAMVTMADDESTVAALVSTLVASVRRHRGAPRPAAGSAAWAVEPELVMSPREAFFAPHRAVTADDAIGRVSAELVAPYPPGIPVLAPGERVTAESVAMLVAARADGVRIAYAADPTLATLRVVA
jgi:lysine decarboxylase